MSKMAQLTYTELIRYLNGVHDDERRYRVAQIAFVAVTAILLIGTFLYFPDFKIEKVMALVGISASQLAAGFYGFIREEGAHRQRVELLKVFDKLNLKNIPNAEIEAVLMEILKKKING
jgi:hypothetical protein